MHTITPHIVVRDAARAAKWHTEALGAEERGRIPVVGGKLMSVELWFGDSAVMVADEFPRWASSRRRAWAAPRPF
jgi:PhnB protein